MGGLKLKTSFDRYTRRLVSLAKQLLGQVTLEHIKVGQFQKKKGLPKQPLFSN